MIQQKRIMYFNQSVILIVEMRQQQKETGQELPYTPVQFAYSETIGSKKKQASSSSIYAHIYRDILTPRLLQHHNPLFYLLFHTPTVYNWMRTITTNQSSLLNSYIQSQSTNKSLLKNDWKSLDFFKKSLEDYVKKWEVVKLSFCHKVYIKRQIQGENCTHLVKTEVYTHEVQYFPKNKAVTYPRIYCKECQQHLQFQCQSREFSQYMLLNNPTQASVTLKNIVYHAYFLINDSIAYVKCANKVWYEVNPLLQTIKPIGFAQINLKSMKIAAYSQPIPEEAMIKVALPFIKETQRPHSSKIQEEQHQPIAKTQKTQMNKKQTSSKHIQPVKSKKSLSELKSTSNQIFLKEPSQGYIQQVSKLYIDPKVKDEYELDYDKGKLKKIKEKKEYIKPNFNQIHEQLKKNVVLDNAPEKLGKKIKKKLKHKPEQSDDDE